MSNNYFCNYHEEKMKNDVFADEFQRMSLWWKMRETYNGRWHDPRVTALSDKMGLTFFWFICTTELYLMLVYLVPHEFDGITRQLMNVACCFIFVETIVNWACVRFTDTAYREAEHGGAPSMQNQVFSSSSSSSSVDEAYRSCNSDTHDQNQNSSTAIRRHTTDCPDASSIDLSHDSVAGNPAESKILHGVGKEEDASRGDPLAWRWCGPCVQFRPPRSHHCVVCKRCILKRDHHCFITGACVGFRNQRHFVVLNFYIAVASALGLWLVVGFLRSDFAPTASVGDYFLPLTVYRSVFGVDDRIRLHHVLMLVHVYSLWWTGFSGAGFVLWHLVVVSTGKTTYEFRNEVHVCCTASVAENYRSVFGRYWLLNFLFPAHKFLPQTEDGVHWSYLKPS